jgi:hypothetical protein
MKVYCFTPGCDCANLKPIEFVDGEWFKIAGRGNVFATNMPVSIDYSLRNKTVIIQGHEYLVTGVELQATLDSGLYKGRKIGLLVRGDVK